MGSEQGGRDGMEPGPASSEQCLSFVALQEVQRLPGWQLLVVTVDQEIKASIRQVLSHHTSTPCQPGKAPGVASSLKDCGLEANVGTAQMAQVRLQIPHMFEPGFGPAWVYVTPPYPTLKAARCMQDDVGFLFGCEPRSGAFGTGVDETRHRFGEDHTESGTGDRRVGLRCILARGSATSCTC